MHYPTFITYALTFAEQFKYPLLFLGAIIEGPIVMIVSGFFLKMGVFAFFPLYVALVLGDLVADVLWYYVGYYFAEPLVRKHGRFVGVTKEVFDKVQKAMHDHPKKILLGSKLTLGLGFALAIIIVAGASKMKLRLFITLNAIGELFYVLSILAIGYFYGQLYSQIQGTFKIAFLIGGIIIFTALAFGFSRYVKQRSLEL